MAIIYPERVFTREKIRELDRRAIHEYGIPGIVLMENASRGITGHAMKLLNWPNKPDENRVLIICGGGNNGGDGLASARHLQIGGLKPTVVLCVPMTSYKGDALINLNICRKMGVPIVDGGQECGAALTQVGSTDLVIDALLGTGLTEDVRAPCDAAIEWMNKKNDAPVLSVDIPSGMDCDTGEPLGMCVKADVTVTLVGIKKGLLLPGARRTAGDIRLVGIGVPRRLIEELGTRISD
jgi:hydroxyethylthiazole kinase-like uncharacterized protein yjeF